jgi:hypothetical protein
MFFDASAGVSYAITGTLRTAAPFIVSPDKAWVYRHTIEDIKLTWNSVLRDEAIYSAAPNGGDFEIAANSTDIQSARVIFGTNPGDDTGDSTRFGMNIGPLNFILGTALTPTQIVVNEMFPFLIDDGLGNATFTSGDRLSLNLMPETSVPESSTWAALAVVALAGLWQARRHHQRDRNR